jgi:hypothetical protein
MAQEANALAGSATSDLRLDLNQGIAGVLS